jgi:hypothetical protein
MSFHPQPFRPALGLIVLVLSGLTPARGETLIYSNDFEAKPGTPYPEWTSSPIVYTARGFWGKSGKLPPPKVTNAETPKRGRRFLGEFGGPRVDPGAHTMVQQTVQLGLKDLPPHKTVTVEFDLLVLKSWDGNSPWYGRDRLRLRADGGPYLLDTSFSNNPKTEKEGTFQDYPRKGSAPHSGAVSGGTLGYTFFGDSIYHFAFTFAHDAKTLALDFSSDLFEGKGIEDESWGLDNVRVRLDAQPAEKEVGSTGSPATPR